MNLSILNKFKINRVNAIIYRSDKKILLKKNISQNDFIGDWNFVNEAIEYHESEIDAFRKLLKLNFNIEIKKNIQLNCLKNEGNLLINHYFPLNLEDEKLNLDKEFDEINKKVDGLIDIIKNSYYE